MWNGTQLVLGDSGNHSGLSKFCHPILWSVVTCKHSLITSETYFFPQPKRYLGDKEAALGHVSTFVTAGKPEQWEEDKSCSNCLVSVISGQIEAARKTYDRNLFIWKNYTRRKAHRNKVLTLNFTKYLNLWTEWEYAIGVNDAMKVQKFWLYCVFSKKKCHSLFSAWKRRASQYHLLHLILCTWNTTSELYITSIISYDS